MKKQPSTEEIRKHIEDVFYRNKKMSGAYAMYGGKLRFFEMLISVELESKRKVFSTSAVPEHFKS